MPSGRSHKQLGIALTPMIVLTGWTLSGFSLSLETWAGIGTVVAGFVINPICLSPDMDLVHSEPANKWKAAEPLWWGYQALIHRGPLSHWPPLSSLLRIFYLWVGLSIVILSGVGVVNLIGFGLFEQIWIPWEWVKIFFAYWGQVFKFPWFWKFVWGVALGDLVHLVADKAISYMRK